MDAGTERLIGALEQQNRALAEALNLMRTEMSTLRQDVASINNKLASLEGGRKALWGLLAAAGMAGAILSQIMNLVFPSPGQ